ncbi:GTP cyclohydrolase I FolE [Candidatus Woesearchaeota archaeon]|nr:GTP cyclohydrolase I FolE [Candidatus Woesearchaeota archaeon]
MEKSYKEIIKALDVSLPKETLANTPKRAADAFRYLTGGYGKIAKDVINGAIFSSKIDEMVLVKDIEMYSLCEHHLLPFFGKCHVAYVPNGKVIGLSKIARVVDIFARRLQIQENLTTQIADAIMDSLKPKGVAVVIEARHLCMMMRGVEKQNSVMKTSCMLGCFKDESTRTEFLNLIR